jgi:hypothetical protein
MNYPTEIYADTDLVCGVEPKCGHQKYVRADAQMFHDKPALEAAEELIHLRRLGKMPGFTESLSRAALPKFIWADYDKSAERSVRWSFYRTRAEQRGNRPDLKPIKLRVSPA